MKRKLLEFLDKHNIVIKVCNLKLEAGGEGFNRYAAFEFPNESLVITNLQKNGAELMYLTFFYNGIYKQVIVPNDLQVKKIVGKERIAALKKYEQYVINDLKNHLTHGFMIGSDPEIFVENDKGEVIPAFDFLGSKKAPSIAPKALPESPAVCGSNNLYWDGFQAEFTTSPQNCLSWQVDSIQRGLQGVYNEAKKHNKNAKLSSQTVMDIPFELIKNAKDEHVEFGCMPSENAYGLKGVTMSGRDVAFRSAGGHLHFGIGKRTKEQYETIVKALDAVLGVACVSLFAKYDNPKRREMYGLAGEYRTPPHGLEYRTLSNAWMFHPLMTNLVFDIGRKVVVMGDKGYSKHWKATEKETIECIQQCDVKKARKILDRNKNLMLQLIKAAYRTINDAGAITIFNVFKNGMESVIKNPDDIEDNWNLKTNDWVSHCNVKGKNVLTARSIIETGEKVA